MQSDWLVFSHTDCRSFSFSSSFFFPPIFFFFLLLFPADPLPLPPSSVR
ncbi:hypothetical protein LINPERHAP2_LOCUS37136, partial [Linum perenne]